MKGGYIENNDILYINNSQIENINLNFRENVSDNLLWKNYCISHGLDETLPFHLNDLATSFLNHANALDNFLLFNRYLIKF